MAEPGDNYMDDKLYEAVRLKDAVGIQATHVFDCEEFVLFRSPIDERNVLHVASRYANHEFISAVLDRFPSLRYELLCKHNSKGETPLHVAAQFGDFETVQTLLNAHNADGLPFGDEKKPCWTERDVVGDTPLHKALRFGHDDIALLLFQMDEHTLASTENNVGESPSYLAAYNFCPKFLHIISDADSNSRCFMSFSGPFGQTTFHPASKLNEEILSILIERRKHLLNSKDNKGKTVLHYAVEENSEKIVETLLKADGSLAYSHDNDGLTPLHRASVMGFFRIVQAILKLSPQSIDIRDKDHSKTALHVAKMEPCFLGGCLRKTRMKELINDVDNDGNTLLHLAVMNSDLHSANTLLEVSAINWRLRNKQGQSPTDLCKSEGETPIKLKWLASRWREKEGAMHMSKFFPKNITNVDDLLNHYDWDSCLDYRGSNGDSILHIAARDGHMDIIRKARSNSNSHHLLLLEKNSKGETPLHLAAEYGKLQVVEAIISLCTSINRFRNENHQPWEENGEANLEHEFKPWRMKSGNGDTPSHKALRNKHSNITLHLLHLEPESAYVVNEDDESLLYLAAEKCCNDVLKEIVDYEGHLFSINGPNGQNPLHAAARNGGLLSVSNLVRRRPNLVNKVDHSGKTPLHHAAEAGRHTIIRELLENNKATAFVYDNEGFTPLLRAAAKGFGHCVSTILQLCPQSIELRDLVSNRTVIHIAKLSSNYWLWDSKRCQIWEQLVNECDRDGNTPLHSAILDNDKRMAQALIQTKGINWRIRNKLHQMPLDICKQLIQNGNEEQRSIYKALEGLEYKRSFPERWTIGLNNISFLLTDGVESMSEEEMNKLLNNIVVVAALLVTITFAAVFTIPGGYDQNNGEAIQLKEVVVQVFVALDVLALFTGIGVLLRYGYAVVFRSISSRGKLARGTIGLLQMSLVATTLAFMCGLYAIVSHSAIWIFIFAAVVAVQYASIPWQVLMDSVNFSRRLMHRIGVCDI